MRITEALNIKKSQYELDFVDIDISRDNPLFLDPYFLRTRKDRWSLDAVSTLDNFFKKLLNFLKQNLVKEAEDLFENLSEPNETCLGLSVGSPKGRGVGPEDMKKIFNSLLNSKAVKSGLIEDIEDCNIFVDGFAKDKMSDLTTNVIRKHLVEYTKNQCRLHNIKLTPNVPTGFYWNRKNEAWENTFDDMLIVNDRIYLLVPKSNVSITARYSPDFYHNSFVLPFLQSKHLRLGSNLVQTRKKSKENFVTKVSIRQSESDGSKINLTDFTISNPNVFKDFKASLNSEYPGSVVNEDIKKQKIIC